MSLPIHIPAGVIPLVSAAWKLTALHGTPRDRVAGTPGRAQ